MKKTIVLLAALGIAASLCACDYTSTTTTTTTDSKGNTKTTTTTKTNVDGKSETTTTSTTESGYPEGSCGAAAEDGEEHTINIDIENETGGDITGLYARVTGDSEWTEIIDEDDDYVIGDGEIAEDCVQITYTADALSYDFGIADANGDEHEFDEIDISDIDENGFTLTFESGDDGYSWNISGIYVK